MGSGPRCGLQFDETERSALALRIYGDSGVVVTSGLTKQKSSFGEDHKHCQARQSKTLKCKSRRWRPNRFLLQIRMTAFNQNGGPLFFAGRKLRIKSLCIESSANATDDTSFICAVLLS
jgi:hypothetical protein